MSLEVYHRNNDFNLKKIIDNKVQNVRKWGWHYIFMRKERGTQMFLWSWIDREQRYL